MAFTSAMRQGIARIKASKLFRREKATTSNREVIAWWEVRRIPFNLLVGCAGLVTCLVIGTIGMVSEVVFDTEFGLPNPPLFALFGIVIYGLLANVCFTLGWITELVQRKLWPTENDKYATLAFGFGLLFSIILTLAPAIVIGAVGIVGYGARILTFRH